MDSQPDKRPVFFFDIDNCLYPKSKKIHDHMSVLIDEYFQRHLELNEEDATKLHQEYYKTYGLAIEGLVRHHQIDPLAYNAEVDDKLPLESILSPDPVLRKLLSDIDTSKVKLWLFTNAYVTHGKRVVKLLGIDDLFEGITFCDYAEPVLLCKPQSGMFDKAMEQAGISENKECYFVDDSYINTKAAEERGWNTVHILDIGDKIPEVAPCKHRVRELDELRGIFPQFFKTS